MKDFQTVTLDALMQALGAANFDLPHATASQLPQPYRLATGDVTLPELSLPSGTLVVIGDLTITQDIDARRESAIANLIVTGDLQVRHAYLDAFLVVGGTARAHTLIAEAGWDGGLFVGGIQADTLVLKDCGLDYLGKKRLTVQRFADFEKPRAAKTAVPELFADDPDDVDAFAFFLALPR